MLTKIFNGLNKVGFNYGKKVGEKVKQDIETLDKTITVSHKEKIADLKTDSGLSQSYLYVLVKNTRSKPNLLEIMKYLQDEEKTSNLSKENIKELRIYLNRKLAKMENKSQ